MTHILLWSIFLSALTVTFFTDYYYLLIHRATTLYLAPLFLLGASLGVTPSDLPHALLGFFVGYGFLWLFKVGYARYRGVDGIGQGDLDLMGMVGSFLGPFGALHTITLGSILGTAVALCLIMAKKAHTKSQLPFGSFLALGCLIYVTYRFTLNHL